MVSAATTARPPDVPSASDAIARSVRIDWIDTGKGFGIILVVFGHVIRGLVHGQLWMWSPTSFFINGWIYAFHMPLFFFISGLFLFRAAEKLQTLAYPYFVWSVITLTIKTPLAGITNHADGLYEFPRFFTSQSSNTGSCMYYSSCHCRLPVCSGSE